MWKNTGTGATPGGGWSNGIPGVEDRSISNAAWYNMMQQELQNLVTGAGLVLTEGNHTQVLAAVLALAQGNGFRTGDGKITLRAAADPGWVMANDGTIGSATSGASTLAHASAQALYTLIWNNVSDGAAQVTGGRGANAAADWAANKPIALTKQLGRAIAVAGHGAGLTDRVLGSTVGAEKHQLVGDEIPIHKLKGGVISGGDPFVYGQVDPDLEFPGTAGQRVDTGGTATGHQGYTSEYGGDQAHNNMQPTSFWNVMIKL